MAKVRMNIELSKELAKEISDLATSEGVAKSEIIRRGLAVMKSFRQQRIAGRTHIGFASDPTRLEAELIGVLNSSVVQDSEEKRMAEENSE